MMREGFLTVTVRSGVATAPAPCHLDCLSGAGRPIASLDGGRIDGLLQRHGGGARVRRVFHARRSLGRTGEHHLHFDDDEEALGLSRVFQVQLADRGAAARVRDALRALDSVERCDVQTLSWAPLDAGASPRPRAVSRDEVQQAQRRIRAAEALAREPGDLDITVAVVDTGIVVGHPEFQRRCMAGYDLVDLGLGQLNDSTVLVGDSRGRDYNPYDDVGHGCLVAGLLGAHGWAVPPGLAGRALLLPIRVLAAARRGSGPGARVLGVGALPDIDAGIKVAVDLGANVINMSLGSPLPADDPHAAPPHQAVVRYAADRGCVLVAAAGNSGRREHFYPAALPEVLAVGSVDAAGRRSTFSSWGPHLALCAPGEGIVGVGRHAYQVSSGTSFASPLVAGAAALLAARAQRSGRALNAAGARRLLCGSARALPGGTSEETGAGLLDCVAALDALDAQIQSLPEMPASATSAR